MLPGSLSADPSNPLTGNFYGTATITSPASLGNIDLAFYLDVTGAAFSSGTSYILLDKTLLFPPTAPGELTKGPAVNGTISPTAFNLSSDNFISLVLDKPVTLRIVLTGTTVTNNGNSILGNYTETITGLTPASITASGTFILVKPVVYTLANVTDTDNSDCISLPEISAGGGDANVMEFSDISFALHLYYNPGISPNICEPRETVIRDAMNEYIATQK